MRNNFILKNSILDASHSCWFVEIGLGNKENEIFLPIRLCVGIFVLKKKTVHGHAVEIKSIQASVELPLGKNTGTKIKC